MDQKKFAMYKLELTNESDELRVKAVTYSRKLQALERVSGYLNVYGIYTARVAASSAPLNELLRRHHKRSW